MKKLSFFAPVTLLFVSLIYAQSKSAPLIITSTTDIEAITKAILGDKGEVVSVMTGGDDPNFIVPYRVAVFRSKEADFFFKNGIALEDKWEAQFHNEAGNPEISIGSIGNIVVTSGINVTPTKSDDGKTQPIIHPKGNPYVWLDPKNGKIIASNICDFLSVTYPKWEKNYRKNLNQFNKTIDEKLPKWQAIMQPLKGMKIVAYQHTFDYFTAKYELEIAEYLEPAPGIPPTEARVEYFKKFIKQNNIKLMILADYNSRRIPNEIAQETGVELLVLPASVGGDLIDTYPKLFDNLVKQFGDYYKRSNPVAPETKTGSH